MRGQPQENETAPEQADDQPAPGTRQSSAPAHEQQIGHQDAEGEAQLYPGEQPGSPLIDLADHQRYCHQIGAKTEETRDPDHQHQGAQAPQPPHFRQTRTYPGAPAADPRLTALMGRLAALEQTAGEQKHQDLRDKQQRQADAIELPGGEDPQALCGELDKSRLSHGALQVA
ncbi:MAG: hypothetical protein CMK33_04180, partial [Porticoccaceae bacterium]|nr:hypothetical protein [Porticoccaceae bacterium]